MTGPPGSPVRSGARQGERFFPSLPFFLLAPYHSYAFLNSSLWEPEHGAHWSPSFSPAKITGEVRQGGGAGREGGNGRALATHALPVLPPPSTERLLRVPATAGDAAPRASHKGPGDSVQDEATQGLERTAGQANEPAGRLLPSPPPASAEPPLDRSPSAQECVFSVLSVGQTTLRRRTP